MLNWIELLILSKCLRVEFSQKTLQKFSTANYKSYDSKNDFYNRWQFWYGKFSEIFYINFLSGQKNGEDL